MRSKWMSGMVVGGRVRRRCRRRGVAAAGAGTRREPQFENDHVKVWKSIIMPNQPLALHRHEHGRTIVALKGGTLDIVDAKGKTMKKDEWESGKAYWLGRGSGRGSSTATSIAARSRWKSSSSR